MTAEDVARQFIAAINKRDADAIYELMSENHQFIDSMGYVSNNRDEMKKGWIGYFKMVPDYLIEISETFVSGGTVMFLGKASGTYTSDGVIKPENHWETIAAWKAVVVGGRVELWQVIADNEPIREIMRREAA